MVLSDLESYLADTIGLAVDNVSVSGQSFLVATGVKINYGSHAGETCEVALRRSDQDPWLPEAALHVRPQLTPMGQNSSQGSPLGPDWQYLSRRFDGPPTPRKYYSFILSVLGEL